MLASGALATEHPDERRRLGLRTNPDGDVDIPDAPYTTFRYPACPKCLAKPPLDPAGGSQRVRVDVDGDGAWLASSTGGVLKPAVIMFGESISSAVKDEAERAVDGAARLLVAGSSLATYSAWRLVKRARERGLPIGVLNLGGVRGEATFFEGVNEEGSGRDGVRLVRNAEEVMPLVVEQMKKRR
jgi:NAD+-dependent protein deacetylase sirtuin 4